MLIVKHNFTLLSDFRHQKEKYSRHNINRCFHLKFNLFEMQPESVASVFDNTRTIGECHDEQTTPCRNPHERCGPRELQTVLPSTLSNVT
jgi:hypothetical protein